MTTIRFIDGNGPGVVYSGTEEHMAGLSACGGCPIKLGPNCGTIEEDGFVWREMEAPEFWVEEGKTWKSRRVPVLRDDSDPHSWTWDDSEYYSQCLDGLDDE